VKASRHTSGLKGSEIRCRHQGCTPIRIAIVHRGGMVLRAADAALTPTIGARASLPTTTSQITPPRLKAAPPGASFNHQK